MLMSDKGKESSPKDKKPKKKGGGMKKFMVFCVLLMIILGIVAGLMVKGIIPGPLNPKDPCAVLDTLEEGQDPPEDLPEECLGPRPLTGGGIYKLSDGTEYDLYTTPPDEIEFDAIAVPVIYEGAVIRRVYITPLVHVVPGEGKFVEAHRPRLEDALVRSLNTYIPERIRAGKEPSLRRIKKVMLDEARKIFGERIVDIYISEFFQQ